MKIGIITKDHSYNAIEESIWSSFVISKFIIYFTLYFNLKNKSTKTLEIKR
jgi:hypothetical protein